MQSDFQKIKDFFLERKDDYVVYHVEDRSSDSAYYRPYSNTEDFYLRVEGVFLGVDHGKNRYIIDSYDSFVFGLYFVDLGDKIIITDNRRSIECGTAAEGSLTEREQFLAMQELIKESGFVLDGDEILKETSVATFVEDAIKLIRLMLVINYAKRTPPYFKMNGEIRKDVRALKKSWKKKRK